MTSTAAVVDWKHHVAPRNQWLIILTGRVAITVTGGERREFGPGEILLFKDTTSEVEALERRIVAMQG